MKTIAAAVLSLSLLAMPAMAMPGRPSVAVENAPNELLVDVATKSQKTYAYKTCRRQYGNRLAFVTFRGRNFVCHFRKSNKQLTKEASRSCRKSGMKLNRVTSIKIKGNKSVTRFVCTRR